MTTDPLALDFDRLEVGARLAHARAHDHRGRPGLVLGPDRRLASPARRRRVGRRAARSASGSRTGCWSSPTPSGCCRSTPSGSSPCAGCAASSSSARCRSATTIRVEAEVAAAAAARRRPRPGRARAARPRRRGPAGRAGGDRGALAREPSPAHDAPTQRLRGRRRRRALTLRRGAGAGLMLVRQATADHRRDHPAAASPSRSPARRSWPAPRCVLTGFGRARRLTERAAQRLPEPPEVLELDVNSEDDLAAVAAELDSRWGALDGVLHAIAFAPEDALGGDFLDTPAASAVEAFRTSAYSLAGARPPSRAAARARRRRRRRRARLRRLGRLARLRLDGRRQGGARVDRPLPRARPRPRGIRVNLVSAGPIETAAAGGIPGFGELADAWERGAPLGWDPDDPSPGRPRRLLPALRLGGGGQRRGPARRRRLSRASAPPGSPASAPPSRRSPRPLGPARRQEEWACAASTGLTLTNRSGNNRRRS